MPEIKEVLQELYIRLIQAVTPVLVIVLLLTNPVMLCGQKQLAGSRKRLIAFNEGADRMNISQLSNKNISYFKRRRLVVKLPERTRFFAIDGKHVRDYFRYLRPWAFEYLEQLAKDYHEEFKKPLRITSALRTIEYQRWLTRRNPNAAPAKGNRASLHTRGIALDISHKNMGSKQKKWLENRFVNDQTRKDWIGGIGKVEIIKETRASANFHVVVFPKDRLPD